MPDPISEVDTDDAFNWAEILTYFNEDGSIASKQILYDLGNTADFVYGDGGVLAEVHEFDLGESGDVFNWEERHTVFGPNGQIANRLTLFDDGEEKYESFVGGTRSETQQLDTLDTHSWDQITTGYTMGVIAYSHIIYDDSRELIKIYDVNGNIDRMEETDLTVFGDPLGQLWDRIETYYNPDGTLAARVTNFDDGVERVDLYNNGVLNRISQTDTSGNARTWDQYETYFNPDGTKVAYVINYDDGREEIAEYTNGTLSQIGVTDSTAPGDPTGQDYETLTTFFDSVGQKIARVTAFDDGIQKFEEFTNGALAHVNLEDRSPDGLAKSWNIIDTYYGGDGLVVAKITEYDNYIVRQEDYQDGVRVLLVDIDQSDVKNWERRETSYDANDGKINGKLVVADNGIETSLGYDLGVLSVKQQMDTLDFTNWEERTTVYTPEGKIDAVMVIFDTGDLRYFSYAEDGSAWDIRVDQDVDGSHNWEYKVVDRRSGDNVVSTYESYDDLAIDYQDALELQYTVTL